MLPMKLKPDSASTSLRHDSELLGLGLGTLPFGALQRHETGGDSPGPSPDDVRSRAEEWESPEKPVVERTVAEAEPEPDDEGADATASITLMLTRGAGGYYGIGVREDNYVQVAGSPRPGRQPGAWAATRRARGVRALALRHRQRCRCPLRPELPGPADRVRQGREPPTRRARPLAVRGGRRQRRGASHLQHVRASQNRKAGCSQDAAEHRLFRTTTYLH